jgi:hypothetical protein
LWVDVNDGQPGGSFRLAFFGFVGLAGTVVENGQALHCQSQQNILEAINPIEIRHDTDLPWYSEHVVCSMSFSSRRWLERIQQSPSFSPLEQPAGDAPLGFKGKDAIEAARQAASVVVCIHEKNVPCLADPFFTH